MSIATEITRIQTAKADLKTSIEGKGVTVPSATKIDGYADLVDAIQTGGGGTDTLAELLNGTLTTYESDDVTKITTETLRGIQSLTSLKLHNVQTIDNYGCYQMKNVSVLAFPKVSSVGQQAFNSCYALASLDYGANLATIQTNSLANCTSLNVFVLRCASVVSLANVNTLGGTPFASGKSGGALYVPSALISSYQAATNWSTILGYTNNSIQAIEGSIYETQYADGTPIT